MSSYSRALAAYLAAEGRTQAQLAEAVVTSQPNIARWANGRLPSAEMAREIDRATSGAVPFVLWQVEAAKRIGLEAA